MFGKNAKEYRGWVKRKECMEQMPYHLNMVNTGSTAGYYAFDYQYWKGTGFNLGWQPQTLYYDFEILKKYGDHLAEGARVFLCIEEFKLLVDHYPSPQAALKYYFILDPEQIYGYNKRTAKLLFCAPCFVKKSFLRSEAGAIIRRIFRIKRKEIEFHSKEEKDIYYSNYYLELWEKEFGWEKGNERLSEEQKKSVEINLQRLEQVILYCRENKWEPIVVIIPFSPNISDRLPESIMQECLWKPIDKIRMSGCLVLDLYHDERLHNYQLYRDGISLNEAGRQIFNEVVQECWKREKAGDGE